MVDDLTQGEPAFTVGNGMFPPARTPGPIVGRLRAALARVVRGEAFRGNADGNGSRVVVPGRR
ncbi:hypothetical protein [Paracraurococcus lichenis]|uniref:Uncharacterized protein n=1 Tax=Paracraurococcus lichenis TaxID=3064888 RepID=A0ABT9EA69_9PROT|nr:hypothetical protein [Paracraurococcus sp. LOR1-02]MDO9712868.1 hypothetical protein [Paracraurococcus sp. LOR1-02]